MALPLFEANGAQISLGVELGRGGEGAVYDIQGRPDSVAKVYLKPPTIAHGMKLQAMAEMANPSLLKLTAWPTSTLYNSSRSITGFVMPKVAGHLPVFKLYGPKLRLQEFPKADWRFLIHAAANTARAFSIVHSAGLVVGDVNHGNLVVGRDATVKLIDCDSFQVSKGTQTWHCEVGVGTHQPPEMQAKTSYAGIKRTPNHDNFGLAVIIFQLLCMARHPFMGRYQGSGDPPSIEEAIAQSRYAYSRDHQRTALIAPPGSLPIEAVTPELRDLFEAAFAPTAINGGRPTADRWIPALQKLEASLKECSSNQGHRYLSTLAQCPWCQIEAASGTPLFPVSFIGAAGGGTGIAALWQQVTQIVPPAPLPPLQDPPAVSPSVSALAAKQSRRKLQFSAYTALPTSIAVTAAVAPPDFRLLVVVGLGTLAGILLKVKTASETPEQLQLAATRQEWETLRVHWQTASQGGEFAAVRRNLDEIKRKHDELATDRAKRLQYLSEHARQRQLEAHLNQFPIASAKISGIGSAKSTTLSSHGIDTAGDVDYARIIKVPGFGPATTSKIVVWRQTIERQFRFDPRKGVPQSDILAVERDIVARRQTLEQDIAARIGRLRASASSTAVMRKALETKAVGLAPLYGQAIADASGSTLHPSISKRLLGLSAAALCIIPFLAFSGHRDAASAKNIVQMQNFSADDASQSADHPAPGLPPTPPMENSAVHAEDTQIHPKAFEDSTVKKTYDRVVLMQTVFIRSGPDQGAAVTRTALRGMILTVYERRAGWIEVGDSAPWGWVYSGLVQELR